MLTQQIVRERFKYNPENGEFVWIKPLSNRCKVGQSAGTIVKNPNGTLKCVQVNVGGKCYRVHSLIWLYVYGYIPNEIDHKDRNPINNRLENLREATRTEQNQNKDKPITNTSGYKGVSWHSQNKVWRVRIRVNGVSMYIGCFTDIIEAAKVYDIAARKYHGEFALTNF